MTCRDAEVAELEDAVRAEQEVLRLHIAVDQTGGVDGGEPGAHLRAERRGFRRRQLPALRDELGERPPLHVLHRDEGTAVVLADVEDAHDVRVREPRRQACLAEKAPLQVLVPGEVLREPLQRHRPVELDVVREVDRGHRPMPQRADELVTSCDARQGTHWSFPPPPWPWWPWWSCSCGSFGLGFSGGVGFLGGVCTTGVHLMRSARAFTEVRSGGRRRDGSLSFDATTSARRAFASCSARQLLPAAAAAAIPDAWPSQSCARAGGTPWNADLCGPAAPPQPAATTTRRAAPERILNTFTVYPSSGPT